MVLKRSSIYDRSDVMNLLAGQLTQDVAMIKLAHRIPPGNEFRDGHDPFELTNFKSSDGVMPKNLDIIEVQVVTGLLKAVYEVKPTATDKMEFDSNGQCQRFMELAATQGIPTYLVVVRMDRLLNPEIIRPEASTGSFELDQTIYDREMDHLIKTAKIELYTRNNFVFRDEKFVITNRPKPMQPFNTDSTTADLANWLRNTE